MDEYRSILMNILKKREKYIESNNMIDLHDFEKFIHTEYKKEILKLIKEKTKKTSGNNSDLITLSSRNSDLIKLSSGKKQKKKTSKKKK